MWTMRDSLRKLTLILALGLLMAQTEEASPPPDAAADAEPTVDAAAASQKLGILPATIPPGGQVAVIKVEGLIYDFTLESLQRRVKRARDQAGFPLNAE